MTAELRGVEIVKGSGHGVAEIFGDNPGLPGRIVEWLRQYL
jgi:hypothetical protein